ncbi:type III secretion system gatekeeper subunit SctW [Iodobacter sp. LRB]|uniref:type III secretion system gatekeeper subunit SctW n=1 Tax=unclassified Iodobacter TaxID=235634 RepID=UPI000C0CF3BA|nr:type III secretion system gatekeeper subunit SctW [Iodobacter sp. BJB302]PHU99650.1 YopN family type III secretion system gatekeeper subunit [Iodobacter sp. BJB302]
MAAIDGISFQRHKLEPRRTEVQVEPEQAEGRERSDQELMLLIQDDLSAVLTQFRRQTGIDKKSQRISEQFERILEDDAEPKVAKVFALLRSQGMSPEVLLAYARSLFPDDSDLVLVLRELLKKRGLEALHSDILEQALEQALMQADPQRCQAGINVGLKAKLHGARMEVSPKALRTAYRDFLGCVENEVAQYEQWVEQFGAQKRGWVLAFLESALIFDIQAHDPSCAREEFGRLLHHTVKLKRVKSSESDFIGSFKGRDLATKAGLDEVSLLSLWFDFVRRPFEFEASVSQAIASSLLIFSIADKAQLLQMLLASVRSIDEQLFFAPESKQLILDKILDWASDHYVREAQVDHQKRFQNSLSAPKE